MSVLIETSVGDIVIDLYIKEAPKAAFNFLKLCKIKYYNNCLFYNIQKDYLAQAGDPTNTGSGGISVYGILNGDKYRYFEDEINPNLRHNKIGIVSTANNGPNLNNSTFFITLANRNITYLNEKHSVFGIVEEGLEVLEEMNKVFVDKSGRPFQNIRIKHTVILEDAFPDPKDLIIPSKSPEIIRDLEYNRLEDDFNVEEYHKDIETEEKVKEKLQEHEARNRALVLQMLEDLPDADIKPPENVLFVCKLNPVTQDDELEILFSRFGSIKSCQVIRDWRTGDSLQYAFIEFETISSCEDAYYKMNGVVIDDRRIKVDFSQSVAKLWNNFKQSQRGVNKLDDQANELVLPNETKKFQIRDNKNFMITNSRYNMVFDLNQGETANLTNKSKHYMKKKNSSDYSRSRSRSRKHRRKSSKKEHKSSSHKERKRGNSKGSRSSQKQRRK